MTSTPYRFRQPLADLVPYEPGRPAEEVRRERGLDRVIKLASNEGPWGPLSAARAAIERGIDGLNRYPDGGCVDLRVDLADRHGVDPSRVVIGHGADSIINNLSIAMLEPADEVVFGWPSFPSYLLDARKMGATPVPVPLTSDYRYDLNAMLAAVTDRTRIVYICNPNNPTGTTVARDQILAFLDALPSRVLAVIDEAYFEYAVGGDSHLDGIADCVATGRPVMVLRTFSKIYGLAGLRVGWGIAPPEVVRAIDVVRNAFDVTSLAQDAARASLGDDSEVRSRAQANSAARNVLARACQSAGLEPVESHANFVCLPLGRPARPVFESLLDEGVIVRPLDPFGMPDALRITVGTDEETSVAAAALARVLAPV